MHCSHSRGLRAALTLALVALLGGCAGVKVNEVKNDDYLTARRGDVLSNGQLSTSARTVLQVLGISEKGCRQELQSCRQTLAQSRGLLDENRLAALSELWLLEALYGGQVSATPRIEAYLESARHAYAYLFFSRRPTSQRAFEDRQTQVRDYYNFAVQEVVTHLFTHYRGRLPKQQIDSGEFGVMLPNWQVRGDMRQVRLADGRQLPKQMIAAASLSFAGLRNQYRRDGLGAELVAVTRDRVVSSRHASQPWIETPFPAVSAVLRFPGNSLKEVLATREVQINGYDPYRTTHFYVGAQRVPLAANFTSGYGLWLARSGFARQSLATLIGRGEVLESPQLYLLQPYDPNRRILVMLHGLASSPEAWINVANEVLGDEDLRKAYQIWQIYYPTNLPIALNNQAIRETLSRTLAHFDPQGTATASQDMVLLGHSMGGVLSRLLVSSAGERLWQGAVEQYQLKGDRLIRAYQTLKPLLAFEPMPQVSRTIFAAAPHRGTPFAENRLSRWAAGLVRLPVSVLERVHEVGQVLIDPNAAAPVALTRGLNSIDNLSNRDPFIRASAELPIAPQVQYHSIIGNYTPTLALLSTSDGVVPYASAHLPGAASELIVPSWHSVQETPEAILEIRRILHEHVRELREQEDLAQAAPLSAR